METSTELAIVASSLEALGNETRLSIFRLLVPHGASGRTVGELQQALDIPASTLSHHLNRLLWSGLLRQERHGRSLVCTANFEAMDRIVAYLTKECCVLADPADVRPVAAQATAANDDGAG